MSFHDIRMPVDIERGAVSNPSRFRTTVFETASGKEKRNREWSRTKGHWDAGYGISTEEDFHRVRDFHMGRRGRAFGFRFKDWADYLISPDGDPHKFAEGDGETSQFQLKKIYEPDGPLPYERLIYLPVVDTIRIFLNGVEQNSGWTIGATTGLVLFDSVPGGGVDIEALGEFDKPARFDSDDLSIALNAFRAGSVPQIGIVELKEVPVDDE